MARDKMRAELERHLILMAEPIDFDQLIEDGLLVKEGAWYRATSIHDLPEHVTKKIKEIRNGKDGPLLKFYSHGKYEKLKSKYI